MSILLAYQPMPCTGLVDTKGDTVVALSASMTKTDVLTRSMAGRTRQLREAERAARQAAARTATTATRERYRYLRPADVPARRNRPTLQGKFRTALNWQVRGGANGSVAFDVARADRMTGGAGHGGYWIILEIGTNASAHLKVGRPSAQVEANPAGADWVRTVKGQRGRHISKNLGWSSGPAGAFSWPTRGASGQQLYLKRHLSNVPFGPITAKGRIGSGDMRITKEIAAQHFVQFGGRTAYREYRTTVLAAARNAFAGKSRPS